MAQTFHIRLEGFEPFVQDPAAGICKAFGVDRARAQKILARIPAIVKKDADRAQAAAYLRALGKIGARVVAVDPDTGEIAADLEPPSRAPQPLGQPAPIGRADSDAGGTVFGLPNRDHEESDEDDAVAADPGGEPLPDGLLDPFRVLREPDLLQLERLMAGVEEGRFSADPHASDPFGKLASESLRVLPDDSSLGRRDTGRIPRNSSATTGGRSGVIARPGRVEPSQVEPEADPFDIAVLPSSGPVRLPPAAPAAKADSISNLIDDLYGEGERRRTKQPLPREASTASRRGPAPSSARSVPGVDWGEDPVAAAPREELRWAPSGEWPSAAATVAPRAEAPARAPRTMPPATVDLSERRTPPPRTSMLAARAHYDAGPPTPRPAEVRAQQRELEHVRAMASGAYAIAAPASRAFDPEPLPPAGPVALQNVELFEPAGWAPLLDPASPGASLQGAMAGPVAPSAASAFEPSAAPSGPSAPPQRPVDDPRREPTSERTARRPAPKTGARNYAEAASPEAVAAAENARRSHETRSIVMIAVAVVLCVIATFVAVTLVSGDTPNAVEAELLRTQSEQYLPGFSAEDEWTGSLGSGASMTMRASIAAGSCRGWTAATEEGPACDLDLLLSSNGQIIAADVALDSYPVVFYCAGADQEAMLELRNASSNRCSYALAAYGRATSAEHPLDPYPELYSRLLDPQRGRPSLRALGDVQRGVLAAGATETRSVTIPGGTCRTVVAAVEPGFDLDASMRIGDEVVSVDNAVDNFPVVSACTSTRARTAEIDFVMYDGSGEYVWQIFDGSIEGLTANGP